MVPPIIPLALVERPLALVERDQSQRSDRSLPRNTQITRLDWPQEEEQEASLRKPEVAVICRKKLPCYEESPRMKRKGTKPSYSSAVGRHLSYDGDHRGRNKKKFREEAKMDAEKVGSCHSSPAVMTTPPCSRSLSGSPGRGLKRKMGCIEAATRIGRKKKLESEYILAHEIGQGKFGSVRLCRNKVSGEEFACKTLPKNGEENVHKEVEIMQHLSGHPSVVTLNAVYEDSKCFHLVMELCSGGRLLDQMVRMGKYSEKRAANLLKELVSVIKYCHDMGVVHRDIKPENILLTTSGKIKLADFGLAVHVANGQRLSGVAGSPAYVAPEVLLGHYTEKVDIWGAGVLLHALLVGVLPFKGESREAVFEAIKTVELNFHTGMWGTVSELAKNLIGRMLTRDVSKRMTAEGVLRHPWIVLHTDCPPKALSIKLRVRNNVVIPRADLKRIGTASGSLVNGSLRRKSEELDSGFVDALAAAISRVRISEPKRTRLCVPASPIQQECSPNMKANLCTAF